MTHLLALTILDFKVFLLILFRISGLMVTSPIFGADTIPRPLKIGLALMLTAILFPMLPSTHGVVVPDNIGAYTVTVGVELALGMLMGFMMTMIFTGARFAGVLADHEMGLALANVIDPVSNEQASILAQLQVFIATIVFLAVSGHHLIIMGLVESFTTVPLLELHYNLTWLQVLTTEIGAQLFVIAFKLAAPAIVTLFMTTIIMGFLARTVPEMNIFILGFSLRIGIGLIVVWLRLGGPAGG
jgi:flagellar biosynthetic protein FliR